MLGRGSRPSPTLRTHLCLPPCLRCRLAWPSGTRTPSVHYVDKRRTDSETMPSSWVYGGDRVCRRNAVRDVVHSIARDAALSHWSRKNWSSSLPELPVMETQIPPALPVRPAETSTAQPTFGFLAVPLGRQRPGTSRSAPACARPFRPKQTGTPALFSSAWSLAHCRLRSFWSQLERAGPVAWGFSRPGFLMSPAAPLPSPPPRLVLRLPSAPRQPFTRETRGQSSNAPPAA